MKFYRYLLILFVAIPLHSMEYGPDFSGVTNPLRRGLSIIQQAFQESDAFVYPDMMLFPNDACSSFEEQWQSLIKRFKKFDKFGIKKTIILVADEHYDRLFDLVKSSQRITIKKAGAFLPEGVLVAFGFYRDSSSRL